MLGRVYARGDVSFRKDDVTNALVSLGGDNGLRGYPSQAFFDFGASAAQGTLDEVARLPAVVAGYLGKALE